MKRLAVGTVLFLLSFSIPAPGSANLVFLGGGLENSLNKIEKVPSEYPVITRSGLSGSTGGLISRAPIHVAPQQFGGAVVADSSLIQVLQGRKAPGVRQPDGGLMPVLSEIGEWLLVMAGFALAGIALRNRSSARLDDRNPAFTRLPLDI